MITSRTGDKHRDRAMCIGVNAYMGKPFQEDALLENINHYLGQEVDWVPSPRVAVLTSDLLQQHVLNDTLRRLGFQVVLNTSPQRVDNAQLTDLNTDVWLVNLNDDDDFDDELDTLLHGDIPVLIGMDEAPQKTCTTFLRWEKKLLTKLRDLTHSPAPAAPVTDAIADKVCLLYTSDAADE